MGERVESPERRGLGGPPGLGQRPLVPAEPPDAVLRPEEGGPVGLQEVAFEAPPVGPGLTGRVVDLVEAHGAG